MPFQASQRITHWHEDFRPVLIVYRYIPLSWLAPNAYGCLVEVGPDA